MENLWQDPIDTWKERLSILHEKKYLADYAFILNDGQEKIEIKAHKMILAACSSEFQNLSFLDNEIIVRDVTQAALKSFVEYVYKETTDLTMTTIWDILKLAKLYAVNSLTRFCARYLVKNINESNALTILDRTSVYGLDLIKSKCMDIISELTVEFYKEPEFYRISANTLKILLAFDKIPGKEIEIYRAVKKWSEEKCEQHLANKSLSNKKMFLGSCLDEIRFCAMTNEEFNSCVEDSFLSQEEMFNVFRNIASNGAHKCKFSSEKRLSKAGSVKTTSYNFTSSVFSPNIPFGSQFGSTTNNTALSPGLASTTDDDTQKLLEESNGAHKSNLSSGLSKDASSIFSSKPNFVPFVSTTNNTILIPAVASTTNEQSNIDLDWGF